MAKERILTVEEAERKEKMRVRLIWLFVIFNLALIGYLIYSIATLCQ